MKPPQPPDEAVELLGCSFPELCPSQTEHPQPSLELEAAVSGVSIDRWLLGETQPEPQRGQEAAPALPASNHGAGKETQPA